MKRQQNNPIVFLGILSLLVFSCSGQSSRLVQTHMEADRAGQPIEDVFILVIIEDQEIRAIFENHFKDWLAVADVEAVISSKVLPIADKTKLEKEDIVSVLDAHGHETILITHIVEFSDTEVFSRERPQYFYDYFGFYNYAYEYVYWPPTVYSENLQLNLETRLYDVQTESLIWSGECILKNPETTGKAISAVVKMVMQELKKNGLLPIK